MMPAKQEKIELIVQNRKAYLKHSMGFLCIALSILMLTFFKTPAYAARCKNTPDTASLQAKPPQKKKLAPAPDKTILKKNAIPGLLSHIQMNKSEDKNCEIVEQITNTVLKKIGSPESANTEKIEKTILDETKNMCKNHGINYEDDIIVIYKRVKGNIIRDKNPVGMDFIIAVFNEFINATKQKHKP